MRLRYLIMASLLAASILTLWWGAGERAGFEEEIVRAALTEEVRRGGSRCPLSIDAIEQSAPWVLAACASGGPAWHEAERRYREDAARVYLVYGQDGDFIALFDRLGHQVVPVIAYFVRNGSTQYLLQETVGQGLSRIWNEQRLGFGLAELSPEHYGLLAIDELGARGHEMLSEFEIVDGIATRKQFTRTLFGAKNILLGGVSDLESVIARGERLPSWSEMGWAAFDAAILVGGVGAATRALRVTRLPSAAAGRSAARLAQLRAAGSGAARSLHTVGRAAGMAAAVAIPYVAITRPDLVAGAAGWLAERAGLPAWLGVFAAYLLLCLVLALLMRVLLGPIAWLLIRLARIAGWIGGRAQRLAEPA